MNKNMLCSRCHKNPAVFFISKVDGDKTTNEGLCIKCAMELNIGPIKQIMDSMGISEDEMDEVSEQMKQIMDSEGEDGFQPGGAMPLSLFQGMFGNNGEDTALSEAQPSEEEHDGEKDNKKKKKSKNAKKRKYLNLYCTDLTERAREGKLDNIIGREKEISRTEQILCRRTKNNPCLIGEPGVGKTAIAEGLALKIAAGDVPAKLANKEIHLLDLTALVAGTQFRGQFESDAEGTMNAANILKPALSRGEIQVIGATTFNEYRKNIEKDAALERRFQPVKVEEPSIADTYQMLLGIKKYYEDFHKVKIADPLVYKAVTLSERYITDRFLPDKAIDLLDEACTCANLRNKSISEYEMLLDEISSLKTEDDELSQETENIDYERLAEIRAELLASENKLPEIEKKASDNAVLESDLATVINLWTGIPASKVVEGDLKRLAGLETRLKEHIIGQDEAVELVAAAIKRSRVQLSLQKRPASFIFVGPTGVGKTELVKQLSMELFDTPETLIRFDMSEFMEKHSVSRLIGSPPGYVGYDEAGQLTEKVRRKPYSIILFDEIEKAHPDVMNILLQILDEGKTNDAHGRSVNFANTVIIMTSNAGSERKENALGFAKDKGEVKREKAVKALNEFLRPEFIGRIDEIVVFNDLTIDDYKGIAKLMLNELKTALADRGIELEYDDTVTECVVSKMSGDSRGARDLRNVIRRNVEDKISSYMVENCDSLITKVSLSGENGEITLAVE